MNPRTALSVSASSEALCPGSLTLTARERASLRVSRVVTDQLIDDLLPTIEYVALFGLARVDGATRQAWAAEARRQAATARAFCTLLDSPTGLGHGYFVGRWISRGLPREDAERRFARLLADLEELEAHLRHDANNGRRAAGERADAHVDHLVRGAAASWRRHTGQPPSASESSAFVRFCMALAALTELPINADRIRRVLDGGL